MIYPPEMLDILARRSGGTNLVIFRRDLPASDFEVTAEEVIAPDDRT